jgi:response regulator of citrate/malate metabolism
LDSVSADVRAHRAVSAAEAADRLGMSRVAARRYLEHLAEIGRVERSFRYGTPGRPQAEFRWRG